MSAEIGMSTRAIAAATGTHHRTVQRELAPGANAPGEQPEFYEVLPTRAELLAEIRAERLAWLLPWRLPVAVRGTQDLRTPEPTVIRAEAEVLHTVPVLEPVNAAFELAVAEAEVIER